MAEIEMKMPSPGESITEVEIATLLAEEGSYVTLDQPIAEIDSDKATLELNAEAAGSIHYLVEEGQSIRVGDAVCIIDTAAKAPATTAEAKPADAGEKADPQTGDVEEKKQTSVKEPPRHAAITAAGATPLAEKMLRQHELTHGEVAGSGKGGKILKRDVIAYLAGGMNAEPLKGWGGDRSTERKKLSTLRKKLAARLVAVKNETAMLTTFNEVDMSAIIDLRSKYKDAFREKFDIGLGFMSFFTKSCAEALHLFPALNAMIDGDELVYHNYADIGIAVSAPKGLMVPVLRNAEQMALADIEREIKRLAARARDGKITPDEMKGGTFTITNGGVFGSMLSTPIINPPQSAILGMHNIVERPVAVNGQVQVRPVMYVALSYDHRIVDGRESVGFLYAVKEMLENPASIIFGGKEPASVLLGL